MEALNAQRGEIERRLLREAPKVGSPLKAREQAANIRGLVREGTFLTDDTGRKAFLVDFQRSKPAVYADGTPILFDLHEVVADYNDFKDNILENMGVE